MNISKAFPAPRATHLRGSSTRITGTPTETPEGYRLINGEDEVIDGKTYHTAYLDNHYTVTFDYDGATSGNTDVSKTVTYGENYGTLPSPSKTGYTFDGWNGKNKINIDKAVNDCLVDNGDGTYTMWYNSLGRFSNTLKTNIPANTEHKKC